MTKGGVKDLVVYLVVQLAVLGCFSLGIKWFSSALGPRADLGWFALLLMSSGVALPLLSAVFVFVQSRSLRARGLEIILPPVGWFVVTGALWFPGLSIYLYVKKHHFSKDTEVSST